MNYLYTALSEQYSRDTDGSWTSCMTDHDGKHPKTRHQAVIYTAIREHERSAPSGQIEKICQEVNLYQNEPALAEIEVTRLVNLVLKNANSGSLNLEDGRLCYIDSSAPREFLFGRDVIPMNTLSVIGGLGGSGKSMAMVHMIGAAAIGETYANRK